MNERMNGLMKLSELRKGKQRKVGNKAEHHHKASKTDKQPTYINEIIERRIGSRREVQLLA